MNEVLLYILASGIVGLFIGFFVGKLTNQTKTKAVEAGLRAEAEQLQKNNSSLNSEIQNLQQRRQEEQVERENLLISKTQITGELRYLKTKLEEQNKETEKLQEKFTKEFENLAHKILEEKSTTFATQNKESLKQILSPLQEKILSFEKKVENTHKESIDYQAALRQQIIGLKELNQQMSKEAINLTKALKGDSKTQGNWGELVLERVLEKSGLEKGREYEMEKSFTLNNETNKRLRPDVIIHLPDHKKMVIDSKVSLTHYEQYVNTDDPQEKVQFLKMHIQSLHRHVEQLSAKKYEDLYAMESPDFVLLFVPIEPAFAVAINHDNALYNKAFEKNIVIVTPTTLLATLRTIDSMWNNKKQQQNAIEIATQAGRLYDQFVNLTNDLIKVGNQLKTVQGSYETSMKKLTGQGNLIKKVENLKNLGVKAKKALPENLINRANDEG